VKINKFAAGIVLPLLLAGTIAPAIAQGPQDHRDGQQDDHNGPARHDDHGAPAPHFVRHDEWRQGSRMKGGDWKRGHRLDYRAYHLDPPPPGCEWREVDGNYVLAAIATGVITSILVNAGH
jgi:Ni/Co efflux regulator RcnB